MTDLDTLLPGPLEAVCFACENGEAQPEAATHCLGCGTKLRPAIWDGRRWHIQRETTDPRFQEPCNHDDLADGDQCSLCGIVRDDLTGNFIPCGDDQ